MTGLWNPPHATATARAARLTLPSDLPFATEFWLGGAHCLGGDEVRVEALAGAWVIDCARDLPADLVGAAHHAIYRVFLDIESMPANYERIESLAATVAACLHGHSAGDDWDHPAAPPERLYVMCTHGLNRSALVMGRILRALGMPADDTVAAIRAARPGALANAVFERLVRE